MSDGENNLGQILVNTEKRFEIYIPKPEARINWGTSSRKKDEGGPYGYPGISATAKDNIFVEAGANIVQQSKGEMTVQAVGDIGHFSAGVMRVTGKDTLLAGGVRLVLAAGAAPGPNPRGPTGASLNAVSYNNLSLHYRVDALSVGLFEFFHGRRHRPVKPVKKLFGGNKAPSTKLAKFNHKTTVKELALHTRLKGGFLQNTLRSFQALYPTDKKGELFFTKNDYTQPKERSEAEGPPPVNKFRPGAAWAPIDKLDPADPVQHVEPVIAHDSYNPTPKGEWTPASPPFGGPNPASLKHGFGSYFARFDPYHLHKISSLPVKPPLTKPIAVMLNTLTRIRRWLDVVASYAAVPGALAAPYVAAITTVDSAVGVLGVVATRFDALHTPIKEASAGDKNAAAELPAWDALLALAATVQSQEKAKLTSKGEPFDLTGGDPPPKTPPVWTLRVEAEGRKALETTITLGIVDAAPATLVFEPKPFGTWTDPADEPPVTHAHEGELVLEVDGGTHRFELGPQNAGDLDAIRATLAAGLASAATVEIDTDRVVITTRSTGAGASIRVMDVTDDADALLHLAPGDEAQGSDTIPAVSDPTKVKASEIFARLDPAIGAKVAVSDGSLAVESKKVGYGSKIEVSGTLADAMFTRKIDEVVVPMPTEDIESAGALLEPVQHWVNVLKGAPDAVMGIVAPLVTALEDVVSMTSKVQQLTEAAGMLAGAAVPAPPESIGLLATRGITMGTQDRIVGTGGHGIMFIVDGGTGEPDQAKFVDYPPEKFASATLGFLPALRTKRRQSLGFRVLSDSLVDLTGTTALQVSAMGRGLAKEARPDGDLAPGIGIARVLGSYAAEVAGYEKVVISARSAGKAGDAEGLTGGRVEMVGQTIAIGGMVFEEKDPDGNAYGPVDFNKDLTGADAHSKALGLSPFELAQLAGAEHLHYDHKGKYSAEGSHLKMDKYCWPEKLRKEHPVTQHVRVHSSKDALVLVGPYMVHVDAAQGVRIGMRKAGPDPLVNEVDVEMPRMTVSKDAVSVTIGKDGETSTFLLDTNGLKLAGGAGDEAQQGLVTAKKGEVALTADKSSLTVSKQSGLKLAANQIDASATGTLKIKGGTVHIN